MAWGQDDQVLTADAGAWGKDDEVLGASPEEPSYGQKLTGWRQGAQISQGEKAKIDQAQSILDDTTHYPEGSPEYVKAKATVFRTNLSPAPEPETTAQGYKEGGLMGAFRAPLLPQRYVETGLNALGEIGATVPSDLQSDPISQNINRAIAERVSGFSSPESLAQLPAYAIPGVAEAQGIGMLSELPDKAEAIKKALKSGDNATAAGDIAGTLLDTAMGAGMAGGRYFKMRADTKAEAIKQALGAKTPVESSQPESATSPTVTEQTQSSPKQMAGNEAGVRSPNPEGLYEPAYNEAGDIRLYHATNSDFSTFDPNKATPTGLGGNAHFFEENPGDDPATRAYGKNLIPVDVPRDKIANLKELSNDPALKQGGNIDKILQARGYEGAMNPDTGEYYLYDPDKFRTSKPEQPSQGAQSLSPGLQKAADDLGLTYSGVHLGKLHLFQDTGEGQKPTSVSVPLNATPEQLRSKVEVARNQMGGLQETSGIANKFSQARTESGELGEIEPMKGVSAERMATEGQRLVEGGADVDLSVSSVMSGKYDPLKDAPVVRFEEARLRSVKDKAYDAYQQNPTPANGLAYDNAFKDLTDFHQGPIAKIKHDWHAGGMGLQGEFQVDLSKADGLREAWLQATGKDAPDWAKKMMDKQAGRVKIASEEAMASEGKLSNAIDREYAKKPRLTVEDVRNQLLEQMKKQKAPCGL